MAVTATHDLSLALDHLKNMVADSTTFRTAFDADDATEAKALIQKLWRDEDDEEGLDRPLCVIRHYAEFRSTKKTLSARTYLSSGALSVLIELDTPEEHADSREDAYVWFSNVVGGIAHDLLTLGPAAGYLGLKSIDLAEFGPCDPRANSGENFWVALLVVHFE